MNKILEVKNVSKVYKMYHNNIARLKEIFTSKSYHKEFIANRDISFDLFEGETLGVIGVNGAGKSTILKIIAGVIDPTEGEVLRHGRVTALLELGTGFNHQMSGRENIYLNGTLIGMTHKECKEKENEIVEFSELGDYIDEPIMTYSTGMSMRLAFSIAIFSEPKILIVDEALSVGDAHFSAKCTIALRERKKKSMSIIYVSHDLNSLKLLCDRVILLNNGEIAKEGTPEDVINKYNFLISKLNDREEKMEIRNTERNSFGTFDVEIINVSIKGENSNSAIMSSGEIATIEAIITSKVDISDMTIGIRITDRFGQDIFGTNTYHNNLKINFEKGKQYCCTYKIPLNIGIGKYSISVAIHKEDTVHVNCLHFIENACSFEIAGIMGEYFIGLCKLDTTVNYRSLINE